MTAKGESEVSELACTYAALILHDDKVPITADKLTNLLKAANIQFQPFWPALFARVLANKNLDDLILSAGGGGGAAPAATGGAPAKVEEKEEKGKGGKKGGEDKKEEKKKKEEPKEEEQDEDMGFGLFD